VAKWVRTNSRILCGIEEVRTPYVMVRTNIKIRDVKVSDLDFVKKIYSVHWTNANGNSDLNEVEYALGLVRDSINKTGDSIKFNEHYIVADIDGEVVGVLGYKKLFAKFLHFAKTSKPIELSNLFVAADKIKTGVGRTLVGELIKRAKDDGYSELVVRSANRWKNSWQFYDKLGFERVGMLNGQDGQVSQIWSKIL